jgi:hypothetical protein
MAVLRARASRFRALAIFLILVCSNEGKSDFLASTDANIVTGLDFSHSPPHAAGQEPKGSQGQERQGFGRGDVEGRQGGHVRDGHLLLATTWC